MSVYVNVTCSVKHLEWSVRLVHKKSKCKSNYALLLIWYVFHRTLTTSTLNVKILEQTQLLLT